MYLLMNITKFYGPLNVTQIYIVILTLLVQPSAPVYTLSLLLRHRMRLFRHFQHQYTHPLFD